ncbi:MAG: alpha-L-fucosidase [Bacteroidales bacterium]|nr:alpha-L-fucosidase [Bacteroidales bacterium]
MADIRGRKFNRFFFSGLIVTAALLLDDACNTGITDGQQIDITPDKVIPSANQVVYQQMEMIGFIHFTINTFTDREWGCGNEDPRLFDPTQMDAEQWAVTAKSGGLKQLILTAKHHDGFCLWPSRFTNHSIKNSPYRNGHGDVVREFVQACRKHGLKVGLYLSPWDRNHRDYGKPEYLVYFRNQLQELLTQYGEINEIWFDGSNGGDGYYGDANEVRVIDRETYYDWENTIQLVRQWQPDIKIFSDAGPDVRWIGNEQGFAGETFWSAIHSDSLVIGASDPSYLNKGDPDGNAWIIGQCDVSIRPGWFYHTSEDSLVKTSRELVDIYYKSVGRNAVLLINLPPDRRGLIHVNDIKALTDFREILDETFDTNLVREESCVAYEYQDDRKYSAEGAIDNDPGSYWAAHATELPAEMIIEFPECVFDRILLQEPIQLGQRISRYKIFIQHRNKWQEIYQGTTIGYKRLIRLEPVRASGMKLTITGANNRVAISNIGLYKSSENE